MISFLVALAALIVGYLTYGRFVSRVFHPEEDRETPAYTKEDGVDYVPMPTWKVYMVQFLNIAGLGPIFGAIMGAKFGTASYLWIVFGCIFAGAVHDYLTSMVSIRMNGASLSEIIGAYLGDFARKVMCVFICVLLILLAATFVSGPAELLSGMTSQWGLNSYWWIVIIFLYYVIATLCPVDKIIGNIYPVFAFCLIFMAVGIGAYLVVFNPGLPELWDGSLVNKEWQSAPVFPMMFITIACGAISGFHGTQSPLMARCLKNERMGRRCFYGAMITEGIVALVWAAAATCFYQDNGVVNPETGKAFSGAYIANFVSNNWLGVAGGILAVLGIAVAPITSGDTALRSARLVVADFINFEQKSIWRRLVIAIPIFILTAIALLWSLNDADGFNILWRYFSWTNQTLSVFTLWALSVYMLRARKLWIIAYLPAIFMTCVCTTYILVAPEGFKLNYAFSLSVGIITSIAAALAFLKYRSSFLKKNS